jgi:LytR cell envelope-related transcriptional attenuator
MRTVNKPGSGSRLRTAGVALFGLATVAVLIGLVLAVNRAEPTQTAAPSAITSAPAAPSLGPSVIPFPPPAAANRAESPVVAAPTTPGAGGTMPLGETRVSRGELRVYNNSTIRGLAARVARDLSAAGWTVVEVGNFAQGTVPTTTVYYQEGTDQRADAEAIAHQFGMRVEPRFPGISNVGSGVIVIVTSDYSH